MLRDEMRQMEQRLIERMGEMKSDLMSRMMTMILTAVLLGGDETLEVVGECVRTRS